MSEQLHDSRDLNDCTDFMAVNGRVLQTQFAARYGAGGWGLLVVFTRRTESTQEALLLQGRAPLSIVNEAREKAGLAPITEKENHRVTWTLKSKHIPRPGSTKARAIDFLITRDPDGPSGPMKPVIAEEDEEVLELYRKMGAMAEALGMVWIARTMKKDWGHVEEPESMA